MKTLLSTGLLLGLLTFGAQGAVTQINGQFPGNDSEAAVQAALTAYFGEPVDLQLYGKSDDDPELFSITDDGDGKSGTWDVLDNSILITYVSVKAGTGFTLYHYDPSVNSGTWTTAGLVNNGGQQPELSHLSFWTGQQPDGGGDPVVPEPMTLGLFGSGLGALLLAKKFRN